MDKNNNTGTLALATALAFGAAPAAAGAQATQFSIMQNVGQSTTFSDPRATGEGLRLEARQRSGSGHITLGAETINDRLVTGHARTWSFNERYQDQHFDVSAAGTYGASLEHTYQITGQRITLDKSLNLGKRGPVTFDAKVGADIGYIKGSISSGARAHITVHETYTRIIPTEKYQAEADKALEFLDLKKGQKFPTVMPLPATADISEIWTKSGKTPYAGVSASLTGTIPLTKHFTGSAQIAGRVGAEKTTSQVCLGTVFTSNANPEMFSAADGVCAVLKPVAGKSSGYFASLAVQRDETHRDLFLTKAGQKAQQWADSGNARLQELANHRNYQKVADETGYTGGVPTIKKEDILNIFGINPHLPKPQTSIVLQGGKTFSVGNGTDNMTAFARIAVPVKTPDAKPHGQFGLSYNF